MHLRVLTALIAIAAAVAGVAAIADARPSKARAKAKTSLKVLACETGEQPSERFVTFRGHMRPFAHTRRMMMRFTLIERTPEGSSPVDGPRQLTRWHRSQLGVSSFGVKKTVTGLQAGLTSRAAVTYRWKRRGGRSTVSVRRWSALCRQDGDLPNLRVGKTTARPGLAAGTEIYSVPVTNTGKAEARSVGVDLLV